MGTSTLNLLERNDNKMYAVNYVQRPIVSNKTYENLGFSKYPQGINAVIAVLSYTGYDIEDAMVINKASYERGFMHGKIYKTSTFEMGQDGREKEKKMFLFQTDEHQT